MAVKIQVDRWKRKDGSISESWRLVITDFTSNPPIPICPPKEDYLRYGLSADDPLEVARKKLKALQAKNKLERLAERKAKIGKRLEREALKESAYLPAGLYLGFLEWLKDRRLWDEIPDKTQVHLRKMREIILEANICPSEMANRPERVYRFFLTKKLSMSYMHKILPLLNLYGYYYCKERKLPWLDIPLPTYDLTAKIQTANLKARNGKRAPSRVITEGDLLKVANLPEGQPLWMEYSFYFGLRPHEVDLLTPKNEGITWRVTARVTAKGKLPVLEINQPKLTTIPEPERRWKRIPCILPRQEELAKLLQSGVKIQRPLLKSLQARLGEGYTLYAGRKSFAKFMRSHKQDRIHISKWLGHQNTKTTDRHYDDFEAVDYTPIH